MQDILRELICPETLPRGEYKGVVFKEDCLWQDGEDVFCISLPKSSNAQQNHTQKKVVGA